MSDDIEPLVIYQQMHGVVPDCFIISEQFRLLMELWEDRQTGQFYSISEDGTRDLAIDFSDEEIKVRTPLLRRYQAARQLDLLLFTESVCYIDGLDANLDFSTLDEQDHRVDGETNMSFATGNSGGRVFSLLLATKLLTPPPQSTSGVWPWDQPNDAEYPDFIVGEDESGTSVSSTCNPKLANYDGADPDAAHYLTPIFFRKEVLQRYYGDPARYRISDGRLECAGLWGIQIDNHGSDFIVVFLGDLGRDLPSSHRYYWRSHNVPPTGSMSETTVRRSFLAQFAESDNPEHIFKNSYRRLTRDWQERIGWSLFRPPVGSDIHLIDTVRVPLNDTDTEFETQILALCKLLVDFLNEKEFVKGLSKVEDEQGIGKFKRYLESVGYEHTDRDIAFLKNLQKLRSKLSAHSKGSESEKVLTATLDNGTRSGAITRMMEQATQMADSLLELSAVIAAVQQPDRSQDPNDTNLSCSI